MKKTAFIILFSFLACLMAEAQGYYRIMGDSSNFNFLTGCTRLQHGGYLSYGRFYINSLGSPGRPAYCKTDDAGNVIWQRYVEYTGYNFYINAAVELPSGEFMFFNFYTNASNNDAFLSSKPILQAMSFGQKLTLPLLLTAGPYSMPWLRMMAASW